VRKLGIVGFRVEESVADKDRNGNIEVHRKGAHGEGEPTGLDIKDFL
jgi:hypothetical protein